MLFYCLALVYIKKMSVCKYRQSTKQRVTYLDVFYKKKYIENKIRVQSTCAMCFFLFFYHFIHSLIHFYLLHKTLGIVHILVIKQGQ